MKCLITTASTEREMKAAVYIIPAKLQLRLHILGACLDFPLCFNRVGCVAASFLCDRWHPGVTWGGRGRLAGFKGPHAYLSASFCSVGLVFSEHLLHRGTASLGIWNWIKLPTWEDGSHPTSGIPGRWRVEGSAFGWEVLFVTDIV